MSTFKNLAYTILQERGKPLHVSELTKIALKKGLISKGSTPQATMAAQLIVDINKYGSQSRFVRTAPNTYDINPHYKVDDKRDVIISKVSTKQKGDIAEARIAELITLYGESSMGCYKPISDDEGIDLIVKKKGSLQTLYLQIKSRFDWGVPTPYTATVKTSGIMDKNAMGIIFCFFNYETGDLWDYVWFIPGPDFLKHSIVSQGDTNRIFVSGTSRKGGNKRDGYLIDKRTLSETISRHMDRL